MNALNNPDMQHLPAALDDMLTGARIGVIAHAVSSRLGIHDVRALELFYESETGSCFHDKASGLYLYSDLYIAEELVRELQQKQ